ncbi:MAGUK p55 subfamily member 6 [Biomphalaria glabrata]|uniref:MAGUK p55 subfamily member 2-like n=1 Tax=Biomphalaria glabrata TaxID=6526 RepID=A0A2C9JZI3_BIOGL|nr:MAGUK p55 subfamily member 2-like [Biomphalaria glabrata]XP_055863235.1 MAGUK p55 subfamily member 2-like [Biomphalaria glabrata]KAI8728487.1 MAGUK p55 subfamily member 6-like [Biomphalaria glabrata]
MPSRKSEKPTAVPALDALLDLQELLPELEDFGASHDELDLLNDVLGAEPQYQALAEIYDILTLQLPECENKKGVDLLHDVQDIVSAQASSNSDASELKLLLLDPHIKSLLDAHDKIGKKAYETVILEDLSLAAPPPPVFDAIGEQHRYVTIRKNGKQPLGITVRLDEDNVPVIARILQDSLADKQGLLRVGDIVKEVNGIPVFVPEDMMIVLKEAESSITFKIVPSALDQLFSDPVYMRACFNYDPMTDRLIPCKKAGLPFREGDILDVVDMTDENWWQAKLAEIPGAPVGLIPSRTLQEKRQAYVQPELTKTKTSLLCGLKTKRKKKIGYSSSETTEFDRCDIKVYEEVTRSNSHRSTLVLVGAQGVGKRSLKERLIRDNPNKFGTAVPHTTRPKKPNEVDGQGYYFIDGETMEAEIKKNMYIDHGEFGGYLYGTRLSTIKEVIRSGKICVLDISARSLKFIQSPEFKPYIIFIAAPSVEALKVMYNEGKKVNNNTKPTGGRSELFLEEKFIATVKESKEMEKTYKGLFDEVIVNDDFENTYNTICDMMIQLEKQMKWVPVEWND